MSRRMPMAPMMLPSVSRRAEALSVGGIISPDALRGWSRTFLVTPRSTTSRSATTNSRASSGPRNRAIDCSRTSSRRRPSRRETAPFASRILPSRSQTKTGSGAFAMMMSAASVGLAARFTTGDRVSDMALLSGRPIGSFARPGLLGSLQIVQNGVAVVDPVVTYRLRWVFAGCAGISAGIRAAGSDRDGRRVRAGRRRLAPLGLGDVSQARGGAWIDRVGALPDQYMSCRAEHEDDRNVAMDLDRPQNDFVGLARSLGCAGTKVEKAARWRSAGLSEPRGDQLGEATHRGQHALVRHARADVHPDRELREADRLAELGQPLDHALGRAVDAPVLHHLVEAHAAEALADFAARPGQERLADRTIEVHRAGLGLLARATVRLGDVDRQDRADLAAPGVAGGAPRRVVGADVALELADARRPHREEDRQPAATDRGVRLLGGGRHAKRRVRLLVRLGDGAHVAELEVLALVREPLLGPRLQEDLERLVESLLALFVGDVEPGVVPGEAASPHAEIDAALADVIERRDVLGQAQGMDEGQHLDCEPDLHVLGPPGDRRPHDEGRGQDRALLLEVQLGQPHGVVAEVLGDGHLRQRVVEGLCLVDARTPLELGEEPDLHGVC